MIEFVVTHRVKGDAMMVFTNIDGPRCCAVIVETFGHLGRPQADLLSCAIQNAADPYQPLSILQEMLDLMREAEATGWIRFLGVAITPDNVKTCQLGDLRFYLFNDDGVDYNIEHICKYAPDGELPHAGHLGPDEHEDFRRRFAHVLTRVGNASGDYEADVQEFPRGSRCKVYLCSFGVHSARPHEAFAEQLVNFDFKAPMNYEFAACVRIDCLG